MRTIFLFIFLMVISSAIQVFAQAKKYYGAEIRTNESFLYGRFEVKMKSVEASGMLISFFTFYDQPDFLTNWNEIDIEILGRYQNEAQFNAIVGKHEMHEHRQTLDFNPHQDFHVYSFEWTPEYIAWTVDGKEVHRQTGEHVARMNKPQKIMMNIWPSQFWDWTGPWQEDKLPLYAHYEFVRYYAYKKGQFELSWEDEFDKLDNLRWSFATHTFDGNACQFDPSNARVKDGRLTLSLTKGEFDPVEDSNPSEVNKGKVTVASAMVGEANTVRIAFNGPVNRINAKKENFKIAGVEILKARFAMDMTNLVLFTSKIDPEVEYELIFTPPSGEEAQKVKIKNPTK